MSEETSFVVDLRKKVSQAVFPLLRDEGDIDGMRKQEIQEHVLNLHRRGGHPNCKAMAETFRRRGARPEAVTIIEDTVCPACVESQMPHPRNTARLEPTPEK